MYEADIVYDNGVPRLANQKLVLDSTSLQWSATLEPQNFVPGNENQLTFSMYDYNQTDAFGIDLTTKALTNYSKAPGIYDEPEGVFPDGKYTLVESDHQNPAGTGFDRADIFKLALDGSGSVTRMTCFANVPTYRASNPVVSDDGRYMAFQMGRTGVAAGTGWGIFLYDLRMAGPNPRC
jgi:Tol biopolymer transport system component